MKSINLLLLFFIGINTCFAQQNKQSKQLDSLFTMMHAQNQFNGVVLIAEKGKIVYEKGFGYSNETTKKLNSNNTIFELASCSKQFTGAAIVLLKRQGKLSYDDKISKYIPELNFWDVTIYDLLRHTSGLPEYLIDMQEGWDKTKIATNEDVIKFYANRKDTLEFEPKSKHRYNNTNYVLLASIIERVSGKTYADFVSDHIFKPLGMKSTFVYNRRQSSKKVNNLAIGYVWKKSSFDKITSENPDYGDDMVYYLDGIVGCAKVNSTVEDLLKWINALKGNVLFTQKEFDEMTEVTKTSAGKKIPYGFGFDVSKGQDKFSFGHTGSWDGYISLIHHNTVKDRTMIFLQNFKMGVCPYNNISQILDNQPLTVEYKKKVAMPDSALLKYVGTYLDEDKKESYVITCKEGYLFYNTSRVKWDMRFFPISENEFQGVRQAGADGVLRFTKSEDGKTKLEMVEYGKVIGSGIL